MLSQTILVLGCVLGFAWQEGIDSQGDKLPHKDAFRRLGTIRFRTGDGILSLAYSPDGKILASGARNEPVRVWDASSGKQIRQFNEHWVWSIAFAPDGKYMATGGANKIIRLWNVETGQEVRQMSGHTATVKSLAFSGDGAVLLSGGDDNTVRLWKVIDGSEIAIYKGHTFGVNAVAISPDAKHFASASTDRTIRVWEHGDKPIVIQTRSAVTALAYLPDRKTLISACDDGFIRLWDYAASKLIREWKGQDNIITHLALSEDGSKVATLGLDRKVAIWDVTKGTLIRGIDQDVGDAQALAMTRDGKQVAAGGMNSAIRRWETSEGKQLSVGTWPEGAVTGLAISPDGKTAVVSDSTRHLHLFDPVTGVLTTKEAGFGANSGDMLLAFGPDSKTLAITTAPDVVALGKPNGSMSPLALPTGDEIRCLAFTPDGLRLAIGYSAMGVRIWDIAAAKIHKELPIPRGARAVAFSPDGKLLAIGAEHAITLHDTSTFQIVRHYEKLSDGVSCLDFAPDSRTLAAGMYSGLIRLFNVTVPEAKSDIDSRVLEGHRGVVNSIAWSINGRCLVSAGFDKTVRLWEFVNGQTIASWLGHAGEVTAAAFHPSGRIVLSGSRDATVLFWDVTGLGLAGKLPAQMQLDVPALDEIWKDLASDNNAKGNAALWKMVGAKDSAAYLAKKVFLTDPKKIKQYLEELNSNNFKVREKAFSALASYERWIEGVLTDVVQNPPSEEVRQRVEILLKRLKTQDAITLDQERLRARRVIEVLEQADSTAARELLGGLSAGAAEESLRDMAKAALGRVSKR